MIPPKTRSMKPIKTRRIGPYPNPVLDIRRRLARQLRDQGTELRVIAEVFQVSIESIRTYLAR